MSVRSFSPIVILIILFTACETKKSGSLRSENDSLRSEIEYRNNMLIVVNEVNDISDSILAGDKDAIHGHPYREYRERIQHLHELLMLSKRNPGTNAGFASPDETSAYSLMVMALQDEVSLRDEEISEHERTLKGTRESYHRNISTLEKEIAEKDKELVLLQSAIEEIRRMNASEAFFIKAQRLEEKGRKIIFARRKKKENFREALELYQKSYVLGKHEAASRINALKKLI